MPGFPTCQLCHQQFSLKGPAPFLLPCLHDICETCVTAAAGGVITCILCQRDVNLTEIPLQKDVITQKEVLQLTVSHNPELVLCTHEEDGNQAVCWCEECEDFFCENCQNVHNGFKGTRMHTVHNIAEIDTEDVNKDNYCSIHPKFIADTWDIDCCMLTCVKCRRRDHAGHRVVYVDEIDDTEKKEVGNIQTDVKSTISKQKAYLAATEVDLSSSEQTFNRLPDNISHTFHSLKTLIDQRGIEMQIELQQHKDNVLEDLRKKKTTSESSLQRCLTTSDYINKTMQYGSLHDILELRPVLEEKSQECRRSSPSEDYKPLPLPVFNIGGLEKIKSTLAQFGTIATEIDQIDDNTTKSEEELQQELQRMTEEMSQLKSSQEKLIREKEEAEKYREEAEKTKKDNKRLQSCLDRLIGPGQEAEIFSGMYILHNQGLEESLLLIFYSPWAEGRNQTGGKLREIVSRKNNRVTSLEVYKNKASILHSTNIKFDKTKYNAECVHINAEGELINKSQSNPPHSDQRLKKYWGTSSTVPLPQCGSPQYFEVESQVGIEMTLTGGDLLLEIGLAREDEQDQHHCIDGQSHSCSVTVSYCPKHSSICRVVWRHSKYFTCLSDALENTPGTTATLHYGVVYDGASGRIAFLDVKNGKIIGKIDNVDSSVARWPMFGVHNPHLANVRMSLVVGTDIDMTDQKKLLIRECLP